MLLILIEMVEMTAAFCIDFSSKEVCLVKISIKNTTNIYRNLSGICEGVFLAVNYFQDNLHHRCLTGSK